MKCFVISDVHSFYNEMIESLDKKGFDKDNSNHILIHCGDLLDRGPDPVKCLEFVLSLSRKILIRGNHEDLMRDAILRKAFGYHDFHNGTTNTAQYLTGMSLKDYQDYEVLSLLEENDLWNDYYNQTIDYCETNKYIFTHGFIPFNEDWRNGDWESARWVNGIAANHRGSNTTGKTIVCGHYHTSYGHCFIKNKGPEWDDDIFFDFNNVLEKAHFETFKEKGIIALDGCTVISGIVNCEVLTIGKDQLKSYL